MSAPADTLLTHSPGFRASHGVLGRSIRATILTLIAASGLALSEPAQAQSIIEQGSRTRDYRLDVEPHLVATPFSPPLGQAVGGLGGGVHFGINVAPSGFLPMVYDSVALSLGIDAVQYAGNRVSRAECAEWQGSGNSAICVRTRRGTGEGLFVYLPVALQWNFYFTPKWSAFAEPGFALFLRTAPYENLAVSATPLLFVGGRFHFSDKMALTMRVGYPYTTVGLSFQF